MEALTKRVNSIVPSRTNPASSHLQNDSDLEDNTETAHPHTQEANCDSHPSLSIDEQLREYRERHQTRRASMNTNTQIVNQRYDSENIDILIFGDSMTKAIKPSKLSRSRRIRCKTIHGAKVENASDVALSHARSFNPKEIILHLGTNNITSDGKDEIIAKITSLADQIVENRPTTSIAISTIIHRQREPHLIFQKVNTVNNELKLLANQRGWSVISNDNISTDQHIAGDGVHLNAIGTRVFAENIIAHLRNDARGTRPTVDDHGTHMSTNQQQQRFQDQRPNRQRRSYADAMMEQASHFRTARHQRDKPRGRMFPRDWLDNLQTAHRFQN